MVFPLYSAIGAVVLAIAGGCIGSPTGAVVPSVDPDAAVAAALKAYDLNGDNVLSGEELDAVPSIALALAEYDKDGDGRVSEEELKNRFRLLFAVPGFAKANCTVHFNNRPLEGAEVVFEPERFLGDGFKTARGTTNSNGTAKLAVPDEELPEANRRLLGGIYEGLYKVSVTHPSVRIPEAYQGKNSVLGWEVTSRTSPGTRPNLRLDSRGTKPY